MQVLMLCLGHAGHSTCLAKRTVSDTVLVAGGVNSHGHVLAGGSAEEPVVHVVRDGLQSHHKRINTVDVRGL